MSWTSFLKRLVPETLRRRFDWLLHPLWGFPRGVLILLQTSPKRGLVQVFYGFNHLPKIGEPIHGGLVKFQRMQDEFPNTPQGFNILYMVSSRMPYGGQQMAWFAKRKGVKFIWNQNGVAYPAWCPQGWKQINKPMAKIHACADYVFYQSHFCRWSASEFLGERQGPSEVLYNAVDTEVFKPLATDSVTGPLVLLLGGTQSQWYRLQVALEVLAKILKHGLEAKLLVSGRLCWRVDESKALQEARAEVERLGVSGRVEFLGPYTQKQAPAVMNRAHILLHTKVNDPCPGLVVEAMACGLPVVYSKSGGVPELVGEDAGIGVESESNWYKDIPPDPELMAQAICQLAKDRGRYAAVARCRAVEHFDLRPWMARHRELFATILQ